MGRRQTIDREHVLLVAETIVSERGAAALTIDAVAKAAGISKGGVQSSFGTKEALISAMMDRWTAAYQAKFLSLGGGAEDAASRTAAHIEITMGDHDEINERSATLLAALLQAPEHLEATRQWYRDRLAGLTGQGDPNLLLAFLATEGAFLLRYLGLVSFDDRTWQQIGKGVTGLIENAPKG